MWHPGIGLPVEHAVALLAQLEDYLIKSVTRMGDAEAESRWSSSGQDCVRGIAHSVNGAAMQVGAARLATMCVQLERAAANAPGSPRARAALRVWYVVLEEVRATLASETTTYEELFAQPVQVAAQASNPTHAATDAKACDAREGDAGHATSSRGGAILTNVRNAKSMLRAHFEEQMAELEAIERAARGEE